MNSRKIRLMPPDLCNQIAAGEVVERPASALKELVENSLDAGAKNIDVYIENGGQSLIRVSDDGSGIAKDELELAITRHATSKLYNFNDLYNINSFGFRGEALPSIASVSRFRLESAWEGQGNFIEIENGRIVKQGASALQKGTIIEVRDLFVTVPARLKFMKSAATELKKIQQSMLRLALINSNIGFSLNSAGKELFHFSSKQNLLSRLQTLWPNHVMENLLLVDLKTHGIRVHGYCANPDVSQVRPDRILLYVNGRVVQDKTMLAAIREAYRGRIISKDYPLCILFLEIAPHDVDVNFHPTKREVRFIDEKSVFSAIYNALNNALKAHDLNVANVDMQNVFPQSQNISENNTNTSQNGFWGNLDREVILPKTQNKQENIEEIEFIPGASLDLNDLGNFKRNEFVSSSFNKNELNEPDSSYYVTNQSQNFTDFTRNNDENNQTFKAQDSSTESSSISYEAKNPYISGYTYLGQISDKYLALSSSKGLSLVDQHVAHELILVEKLRNSKNNIQNLLMPIIIELHESEHDIINEFLDGLREIGFEIAIKGAKSLEVKAIPSCLDRAGAQKAITEIVRGERDELDLWTRISCSNAIKSGDKLTNDEAAEIIKKFLTLGKTHCPHGRPCIINLDMNDLDKMFKRK